MIDPDLKKCDFGALAGLLQEVTATNAAVTTEINDWMRAMGIASMDMLDQAGGAFTDVATAIRQVGEANQEMQLAIIAAGGQSLDGNMATVNQCAAAYQSA